MQIKGRNEHQNVTSEGYNNFNVSTGFGSVIEGHCLSWRNSIKVEIEKQRENSLIS